ncbi:MAG: AbrB/MazE/SpoVT family DNA-binding domain-containing protein [Armatimonadota bacterium]|nr:AbrB/MazE/SpoVT family DNA-binding domain-containing protein [bacterium]
MKQVDEMSIVRVSEGCLVEIPEAILTKLGAKPGQEMMVAERDGGIILTPLPSDPVSYLCGALAAESSLTRELAAERADELEAQ